MAGMRPDQDDIALRLKQRHERDQARDLLAAMDTPGSPLNDWSCIAFGRATTRGHGNAIRDIDCLLYAPGLGLVMLDFKDYHLVKNEESYKEVTKCLQQVEFLQQNIAVMAQAHNATCAPTDRVPTLPPPTLPVVGSYHQRQAIIDELSAGWRQDGKQVPVILGMEACKDTAARSPIERATVLRDLLSDGFRKWESRHQLRTTGKKPPCAVWSEKQMDWLMTALKHGLPSKTGLEDWITDALARQDAATLDRSLDAAQSVWRRLEEPDAVVELADGRSIRAAHVPGYAGTGKTWAAIRVALEAANRDERTLLLCRSARLCDFVADNISTMLDALGGDLARSIEESLVVATPAVLAGLDRDFDLQSQADWATLGESGRDDFFRNVVVDEAQDFGPIVGADEHALERVMRLLAKDGRIILFGDPAQATVAGLVGVRQDGSAMGSQLPVMSRNLRSSPDIVRFLIASGPADFYDEPDRLARTPAPVALGGPARDGLNPLTAAVGRALGDLRSRLGLSDEALPASRVVVLVPDFEWLGVVAAKLPEYARYVPVYTIDEYKGLECECVVLVVPDGLPAEESVLSIPYSADQLDAFIYTGSSRARAMLTVVHGPQLGRALGRVDLKQQDD